MQLTPAEQAARDAAAERDAGSAACNAARRSRATLPELARFVARAADVLARRELGLAHGLADERLLSMNPACGPGAFLAAAAAVTDGRGAMRGVDLDARAIALARAALRPSRCTLEARDTLNDVRPERIARLAPALCVLGNPPWVASAQAAPAPHLAALLEDFRREPGGERVKERKLGVLADALHVRFLRWGCEGDVPRRARAGGVLAFVTNGSYLDGPVHRALRTALRRWFSAMYCRGSRRQRVARAQRTARRERLRRGPSVAILAPRAVPITMNASSQRWRFTRVSGALEEKPRCSTRTRASTSLAWRTLCRAPSTIASCPRRCRAPALARAISLADAMPFQREGVQTNR